MPERCSRRSGRISNATGGSGGMGSATRFSRRPKTLSAITPRGVYTESRTPPETARKGLASQAYLREPITYAFTADTISGTSPSVQWTIGWSVVKRICETKSLFLVYQTSNAAVIVPKRFFQDPSEIDSWRQFVGAHLDSKRIEKPGFVARFC